MAVDFIYRRLLTSSVIPIIGLAVCDEDDIVQSALYLHLHLTKWEVVVLKSFKWEVWLFQVRNNEKYYLEKFNFSIYFMNHCCKVLAFCLFHFMRV